MRKSQLENLKIGDKVQGYDKALYTVVGLPVEGNENSKYKLEGTAFNKNHSEGKEHRVGIIRAASESSLLKNYKLVEEEPVQIEAAITVEVPDIVGYLAPVEPEVIEVLVTPERDEEIKTKVKEALGRRKKSTKVEPEEEMVTSADLAKELGITPQDLRRVLRKNNLTKPEGGWKWNPESEEYKNILGILKGVKERRDAKRK